jgi:hypothetical protein
VLAHTECTSLQQIGAAKFGKIEGRSFTTE